MGWAREALACLLELQDRKAVASNGLDVTLSVGFSTKASGPWRTRRLECESPHPCCLIPALGQAIARIDRERSDTVNIEKDTLTCCRRNERYLGWKGIGALRATE